MTCCFALSYPLDTVFPTLSTSVSKSLSNLAKTFDNENYFITASSAGRFITSIDTTSIPTFSSDNKTPKSNNSGINYVKKKEKPTKLPVSIQFEFMCCLRLM